jgi:HEAT repeat protein
LLILWNPVPLADDESAEQDAQLAKLLDAREIPAARAAAARRLQRTPPGPEAVPQLAELLRELRPKPERVTREIVDFETNRVERRLETKLPPLDVWQNTAGLGAEVAAVLGKMGEDAASAVPEMNDFLVDVLDHARAAARECYAYQSVLGVVSREKLAQSAKFALAVDAVAVHTVGALGDVGSEAARAVPLLAMALKKPIFPARSLFETVGTEMDVREYFLPESVMEGLGEGTGDADDLEDFRVAGASPGNRARAGGPAARGESKLRDAAAAALGKIGSRPAVEALHDVIAYGDEPEVLAPSRVRALAYSTLEKMSRDHPDATTRAEAARAIKRLRPAP